MPALMRTKGRPASDRAARRTKVASVSWAQVAQQENKRGQPSLLAVEWTPPDHPSKAGQRIRKPSWDVVARDWHGGEFCRRAFATRREAEESLALLRRQLAECNGNVLGALEAWVGGAVQVPLWWGDR